MASRGGRRCEANNLICADSRKSSLRTLPRHTLSVFHQSQSRDLHVYWKAVPSRDPRPGMKGRFSSLSLPPRIIDTERSLCLLSDDCSRHARIRAEKRNLPGISRFEGSPRAKQLDEIRHREEFYPASSWDPGLFALPRSLQVMGESGDKKGIKGEISSHGGQVSNGWIEEDSPEELGI